MNYSFKGGFNSFNKGFRNFNKFNFKSFSKSFFNNKFNSSFINNSSRINQANSFLINISNKCFMSKFLETSGSHLASGRTTGNLRMLNGAMNELGEQSETEANILGVMIKDRFVILGDLCLLLDDSKWTCINR